MELASSLKRLKDAQHLLETAAPSVDAGQVGQIEQQTEEVIKQLAGAPLKLKRALLDLVDFVGAFAPFLGIGAGLLAVSSFFDPTPNQGMLSLGLLAASFALGTGWYHSGKWLARRTLVDAIASNIQKALQPRSSVDGACHEALSLVDTVPAAAVLRDAVIARGEVLRLFHLTAMRELARAKHRARGTALHGAAAVNA